MGDARVTRLGVESISVNKAIPPTVFLFAMILVMGLGGIGYFTVPGAGGAITVMHIPVILAGILDGALAGGFVGLTFGFLTWLKFSDHHLLVHLLPRVLIGLSAGLVFSALSQQLESGSRLSIGAAVAAAVGSLVNTVGVCALALWLGSVQQQELWPVLAIHAPLELVLAVVVTVPLTIILMPGDRF